jgi:hypothetical protein
LKCFHSIISLECVCVVYPYSTYFVRATGPGERSLDTAF